jgi:hypothetical protein
LPPRYRIAALWSCPIAAFFLRPRQFRIYPQK